MCECIKRKTISQNRMQLQCIKFSVSVCGKINEHTERLLNVRLIRFGGVLWESSLNFSVGQGKRKKGEQSEENSCAVETVEEGSKRPETHCVCVYVIQRNNKTFLYGFCLDRVLLCVFFFFNIILSFNVQNFREKIRNRNRN